MNPYLARAKFECILKLKLKLKYALRNAASMHVTVGLQGENREILKTLDRPPGATMSSSRIKSLGTSESYDLTHIVHSSQMLLKEFLPPKIAA